MTIPGRNIQIIALAFGLILLTFGCGVGFSEWFNGRDPTPWHFILPLATVVLGFGSLATLVWKRNS